MNPNISCPCCSSSMLRHLSSRRSFWFCNHCRLEMPDTNKLVKSRKQSTVSFDSPVFPQAISSRTSSQEIAAI